MRFDIERRRLHASRGADEHVAPGHARPAVSIWTPGGLVALCVMACFALGTADAGTELHLSWREPLGGPRAASAWVPACGDTAHEDTLYLSLKADRPQPGLASIRGTLLFHPQPGDTLGNYWHFKTGWENGGGLWASFSYLPAGGDLFAWHEVGVVELDYDHRSGRGKLDFKYAAEARPNLGLEPGLAYPIALIRFLHKRPALTGCGQPVCIELAGARLLYTTGREEDVVSKKGRYASWNGASICEFIRRRPSREVWIPPLR